jgi:hypothetical protein
MSGVIHLKCISCGVEVEEEEELCYNCIRKTGNLQVLTEKEQQEFSGITLEQGPEREDGHYEYESDVRNQQGYSRQFTIINMGFFTKLILGLIFLGVIFVALPVVLVVVASVSFILYFFRR